MLIQEVIEQIEAYAPTVLQAGFDNSGLICGSTDNEVRAVLLCLDVTEAVLQEAIDKGCNVIISHHPLLFRGLKHLTQATYVERCLWLAIKHDITIYAAHTNMDVVQNGVSGRMADKLHLQNRTILQEEGTTPEVYGYGLVGELATPVDPLTFLWQVKEIFHCTTIRYTTPHCQQIRRVALCGGSGASFLQQAIQKNADIYLSGDFKYHDFFETEDRIMIADIGHYESEQFTKEIFYELVTKKISKFAVRFSEVNTNPINYL